MSEDSLQVIFEFADGVQAPLTTDVKISYQEQNFNSTLFGPSIYRQEPSPAVDQAWVDLGVYCEFDMCEFAVIDGKHILLRIANAFVYL